jgi:heterodisulfide reductase subunit D
MKLDVKLRELERQFSLCIRCKQCTYGSWPKNLPTCPINDQFKFFTYSGGGLIYLARAILLGLIPEEKYDEVLRVALKCTTCGYCGQTCKLVKVAPPYQNVTDLIRLLKINLVKKGVYVSQKHQEVIHRVKEKKCFFAVSFEEKVGLKATKNKIPDQGDVMIFAGCMASYEDKEILNTVIEILNRSSVDYRMMDEEWCCGGPLVDLGDTDGIAQIAEHNIEAISRARVDKVIFLCPHCQEVFMNTYPEILNKQLPFESIFITKYLRELLKKNRLKPLKSFPHKVAYHDPCYLGRYLGDFDSARGLLEAIPGLSLVEATRNRGDGYCCGAGGGTKIIDYDYSVSLGRRRLKDFGETGAEILVTSCPLCKSQFLDLNKKDSGKMVIQNVVEILGKSLDKG